MDVERTLKTLTGKIKDLEQELDRHALNEEIKGALKQMMKKANKHEWEAEKRKAKKLNTDRIDYARKYDVFWGPVEVLVVEVSSSGKPGKERSSAKCYTPGARPLHFSFGVIIKELK
ncbi:hypothetical protein NDU88_009741 [Pleurodeles waltl]|uniref:Uncharacterized protein n=1 Tax=Pleurodeles waltl TaxID=8319 RepID=A0AAV7S1A1_PLEWA|nr:hypothetical protein NDU88_009741 [Pleurodeles waltl]